MEYQFVVKLLSVVIVMYIATVQSQDSNATGFSLTPSNITARLLFPARFDCQATAGFIRWAVGDDLMLSSRSCPGCELLSNSSLYFPSVTQAHGGRYTCFIVGVLGVTPRHSVYLTVAEAPRITLVTPANVTVIQNETLEINVNLTGVPQPDVTWRKDDKILNADPRFIIIGSNLSLLNAQHIDAGEYTITAQNIADIKVKRYNVIIQFSPIITITRNPDSDMVEEDTMVMVTCLVTSNPQSSISWEQVTANYRTDRTNCATTPAPTNNSFNTVSSNINFTNEDINGFSTFCCSASNDIGMTTSCLNFTETGLNLTKTDASVVSNNGHHGSATIVVIAGTMGTVIILLTIIVVLCAMILCMNRTRDASSMAPSYKNTLNSSTIKPIHLDVITTNISYNIPTKAYNISVSSEDDYNYVQPNQFNGPSNLEDDIKMETNPSYGVITGENRVTAFNTTTTDSDTRPHPFSLQDDYNKAIATSDNAEENNDTIHVKNSYLSLITTSAKQTDQGEDSVSCQSQNEDSQANQQGDTFWYTVATNM